MWITGKILVATDFGEPSRVAADVAAELARKFSTTITLLHAHLAPMGIYTGVPIAPVREYAEDLAQAARDCLHEEASRVSATGADVTPMFCTGVPWEEILATAERIGAGLIVLGTHGRRGLPRALLGSVAEKVVRLSPVPVLTLHERPPTHKVHARSAHPTA